VVVVRLLLLGSVCTHAQTQPPLPPHIHYPCLAIREKGNRPSPNSLPSKPTARTHFHLFEWEGKEALPHRTTGVWAISDAKKGKSVTNKWYLEALKIIQQKHPWYNRSNGRDHVWPFPGARGPHIFQDWKKHIRRNIFLTPEGDRSLGEQFNTWKVRALCLSYSARRRTFGLNVVGSVGRLGAGAVGMRVVCCSGHLSRQDFTRKYRLKG